MGALAHESGRCARPLSSLLSPYSIPNPDFTAHCTIGHSALYTRRKECLMELHRTTLLDAIHPAIIDKIKREREREFEDRRLPLYLPVPEAPKREIEKEPEVTYEINFD